MLLHNGFDFLCFKGAGHVVGLHACAVCDNLPCGQKGAGCDCFRTAGFDVMAANAAAMHDLQNN